ncbi:hypothetical protein L5515_017377 [Caenorhabditis briggsae]|uniref:Uncharacterized protein n=1 Tax=Caenorhabditis briggsae TaxID=6238 RepID=A0AAE9JR76_CAEBR|nr:hypothetical protein L5515_017377 [Caenorhabditis briggsae]
MIRRCLPSSTYDTPAGEPEWSRETFGEQSVAVLLGGYRNPIKIAQRVVARCGSNQPFYVMDVAAIERRLESFRSSLPLIRPNFSIACNADPLLSRVLSNNLDVKVEVATLAELDQATLNWKPSRLILCSQLLTRKVIKKAVQAGCQTFVVENETEIINVMSTSSEAQIYLAVCLPYFSGAVPFGFSTDDLEQILDKTHSHGANIIGVYLELGVRATLDDYIAALHDARSIMNTAVKKFPNFQNVSLGTLLVPSEADASVNFCKTINSAVSKLFDDQIVLTANIGRFLVTDAFILCTNVIGKRAVDARLLTNDDFDEGVGYLYQTNDGIYGSFCCKLMDINPQCKPLNEEEAFNESNQLYIGTVLGPNLDGIDVAQRYTRCRELRVGEWLVWENMGAFTIPADAEHHVPPVFYYSGKECWEKIIHKDEQRRSPLPSVNNVIGSDGVGNDGKNVYVPSCENQDAEMMLEQLVEDLNEVQVSYPEPK